jgi:hypothetical protein
MDPTFDTEESLASAAAEEAVQLAEETRRERDVPMTWATVEGHPAMALLAVVEDGDILVVGPVVVIRGVERHQGVTRA